MLPNEQTSAGQEEREPGPADVAGVRLIRDPLPALGKALGHVLTETPADINEAVFILLAADNAEQKPQLQSQEQAHQ